MNTAPKSVRDAMKNAAHVLKRDVPEGTTFVLMVFGPEENPYWQAVENIGKQTPKTVADTIGTMLSIMKQPEPPDFLCEPQSKN